MISLKCPWPKKSRKKTEEKTCAILLTTTVIKGKSQIISNSLGKKVLDIRSIGICRLQPSMIQWNHIAREENLKKLVPSTAA